MMYTDLRHMNADGCERFLRSQEFNLLCAAGETEQKGPCLDMGGPLIYWSEKRESAYLIGTPSSMSHCYRKRRPGVFTRIYAFNLWIEASTRDADYCRKSYLTSINKV